MADFIFNTPAVINYAPGLFRADDNGKYGCDVLFDKNDPNMRDDLVRFTEYLHDVYREGCTKPGGKDGTVPFAGLNADDPKWDGLVPLPLHDGDTTVFGPNSEHAGETRASVRPEYAGRLFMSVTTTENPLDAGRLRDCVTGAAPNRSAFYSGARVKVKVWVTPWSYQKRKGYTVRLTAMAKVADGEPIAGAGGGDPFSGMELPDADAGNAFSGMGV